MRIVYADPGTPSWYPITVMAELTARLLEAELVTVAGGVPTWRKLRAVLPRSRRGDTCLVIAPEPVNLQSVLRVPGLVRGHDRLVGWVIDSWWDDRIPQIARAPSWFDDLYITENAAIEAWRSSTGTRVEWLPVGTDALGVGAADDHRPVDLLRVGRQPEAWSDDELTARDAAAAGVTFAGRPPFHEDRARGVPALLGHLRQAKFVLAFGNRWDQHGYTHPTREYLTPRWTDALACGATVAGVAPDCSSARELLWERATLDLGGTDRSAGLATIAEAVRSWTPDHARRNHLLALQRLDWRWRVQRLATDLDRSTKTLDAELGALRSRIAAG